VEDPKDKPTHKNNHDHNTDSDVEHFVIVELLRGTQGKRERKRE
jgi:hypothetical protein